MKKSFVRFVVLVLISCLVVDPAISSVFTNPSSNHFISEWDLLQQQAINGRSGWVGPIHSRQITSQIQQYAGELKRQIDLVIAGPELAGSLEGFDLDRELPPSRQAFLPGAVMKSVPWLDHPQLGHVLVAGTGKLIMAKVSAFDRLAIWGHGHWVCTPILIRAVDKKGEVWIGNAHLHPEVIPHGPDDFGTDYEQFLRVLEYLKARQFTNVQVQAVSDPRR